MISIQCYYLVSKVRPLSNKIEQDLGSQKVLFFFTPQSHIEFEGGVETGSMYGQYVQDI